MTREIKFRAINKKTDEMVYNLYISSDGSAFEGVLDNPYDFDDKTIGQYTGLKDATKWEQLTDIEKQDWINKGEKQQTWKGKEIYEGDIMKVNVDNEFGSQNERNLYVHFCPNAMGWTLTYPDQDIEHHYCWSMDKRGIVIGNFYQNKELLN